MGDVVKFKPPSVTRQQHIESVISLGAADGARMHLVDVLEAARSSAWREVTRIAEDCCDSGWCAEEGEYLPLIATVEDTVKPDLIAVATLVVACDRLLAQLTATSRTSP